MSFWRPEPTARPGSRAWPQPAVAGMPGMSDQGIVVDRIACDGYGSCAELLPEMIVLDEWGYPIIRPGPIPVALLDHARMAADTCPVLALRLATAPRATMSAAASNAPAGTRDARSANARRR
jgi:ferredoxin